LRSHPPPCLIVLDLWMPRMGGREFLDAKDQDPALACIPVFVLSAIADRHTDLLRGAVRWVERKPARIARLLEAVESCR
jgi:CheY-like chemotaxis protein